MAERPTRTKAPARPRPRPQSPARREVLRAFREQVSTGTYRPPVDELSAELVNWLLQLSGSRSPLPRDRG